MKTFTDIKVGDKVIVFDEYAHDYNEHTIEIQEVETDEDYVTRLNPTGIKAFGKDLTMWDENEQGYLNDDYISLVYQGNFICFVADNKEE